MSPLTASMDGAASPAPLASSLSRHAAGAGPQSEHTSTRPQSAGGVRFNRPTATFIDEGTGGLRLRSNSRAPADITKRIFEECFDWDAGYPLLLSPVSQRSSPSRDGPSSPRASRPTSPQRTVQRGSSAPVSPFAALSTMQLTSPSLRSGQQPRRRPFSGGGAVALRKVQRGRSAGDGLVPWGGGHAATDALDALLSKLWTRQEVQQLHARGFAKRVVLQLSAAPHQRVAALLLASCSAVWPPILEPHASELCVMLGPLLSSPADGVRQAGMQLLAGLCRCGGPARVAALRSERLVAALCAQAAAGGVDTLAAMREVAMDLKGAALLEANGVLRHLCALLRRLAAGRAVLTAGDSQKAARQLALLAGRPATQRCPKKGNACMHACRPARGGLKTP